MHIGPDEQGRRALRLRDFSQDAEYRLSDAQAEALIQLFTEGALMRVFELDREYAPFYCPACDACYCAAHWKRRTTYDQGFYDAEYGTCPQGHERMLFD